MPVKAISFEELLQDPDPRRAMAYFTAGAPDVARFVAAAEHAGRSTARVTLSTYDPAARPPAEVDWVAIWQDLPLETLNGRMADLVSSLIFPLWFAGRRFAFFSAAPRAAYAAKDIEPGDIHGRRPQVDAFLLREQLLALLDEASGARAVQRDGSRTLFSVDADLDANQRRAQRHVAGPIRVLAPAGSGKTKTLTNRIIHLLNEGVPGESILALAFNRKAAREMTERLAARGVRDVDIRTFHALGYRLLRQTLGWPYDPERAQKLTRALLRRAVPDDLPLAPRRDSDPLEPLLGALSRVKSDLPALEEVLVELEEDDLAFKPVFENFLQLQARRRLLTFDDMIYLATRMLLRDDDLRRRIQARFHYVLVDEFQDLNEAQMLFLRILALPQNNLFVVGDDDQMIYGWRGATVEHILGFPQRFPTAESVVLTTNYRSAQAIVEHSRRLIGHNRVRVAKDIQARHGAPPGAVTVELADSLWEQAQRAAEWLAALQAAGDQAWHDFAILFRYRAYQYPLALALDRQEVPHAEVDLGELFRTGVGRDLHAYLQVLLTPREAAPASFQRILKRPNKFLTNAFVESIGDWAAFTSNVHQATLPPWAAERLETFVDQVLALQKILARGRLRPTELLFHIDQTFGLLAYYEGKLLPGMEIDGDTDAILLQTLYALAGNFARPEEFYGYVDEILAAPPAGPGPAADPTDAVIFSTIHQAKGREYPNVVYFNLSADAHSTADNEIEEERRVAYVAATRAQERLLVTADRRNVSPFLRELLLDPALARSSTADLIKERNKVQRRSRRGGDTGDNTARIGRLQAEIDARRMLSTGR